MSMPSLTQNLCGPRRPGHFEGVLLVVARLFHLCAPDRAFFGLKDYQQFCIIRQMVKDLNFPLEVVGCQTVRESDGLAMSSRNANLKPEHREQAALIYRGFKLAEKALKTGTRNPADLAEIAMDVILSGPDNKVEYVEVVDPLTLERLTELSGECVIAAAMHCGDVRLIDNMRLG
jgi:pantoate--beta-alanine ligase